ncbi:MAG TPA: hypothetical protein VJ873_12315, partial [bacterium]|nr:hypothetical protein [bacterium]
MAYILQLRFSDGTEVVLTSNEISEHKAHYIPSREEGEPRDWHHASFDDTGWLTPYSLGTMVPGITMLTDLGGGQDIQFLSASSNSPKARYPGERHLYRREFHLDISPNPLCGVFKAQEVKKPVRKVSEVLPRATPLTQLAWAAPILPPSPTATPKPLFVWRPSPTPTTGFVPAPVPTWTFTFFPTPVRAVVPTRVLQPHASLPEAVAPVTAVAHVPTAVPTWTFTFYPTVVPTVVPIRVIRPAPTLPPALKSVAAVPTRPQWRKPTPTPIPAFGSPSRVEPIEDGASSVPTRIPEPTPTVGPISEPPSAQAQTIVFENQPANIYISFADGPGVYR